ncbi:MAG TPA: TonB-dependent receptor, partial [Chitinophagaceae bacterium]|nr:TonB-dependent receptor [Chitinophagaceae bacterium]
LLLGAYDNAVLNTQSNKTESQKYILGVLPEQKQWNYTNGIVYKHYKKNSFQTLVLSRNMFDNYSFKYRNNDANQPVTLKYQSQEIENKFRAENTIRSGAWKLNYGVGAEYVKYNNYTYNVLTIPGGVIDTIQYESEIDFIKYAAFGQVSRSLFRDALTLSLGIRADGNTYSSSMQNLLKQLSPRFSASYKMTERLFVNLNSGLYYQLPAYTTLGFKNADNVYINKLNQLKYIQCAQAVGGLEYSLPTNLRFSMEGFYKKYSQYPQSVSRGLSLANTGGDFGVVGNESVQSVSTGRSYGLELFMQQKLYKGMYGLLAVTLFRSEFTNANTGDYSPSNWDQRFIVNATLGKKIKRGWEIGGKFRFTGGRPYTPYDTVLSSVSVIWDVAQSGQINYQRANENRLPVNHQLDIRIDKKYFFKHWNLNFFLDVQNVYGFVAKEQDILTVKRDSNGNPLPDPNSGTPARYQMQFLSNGSGTVLPTIGIIVEY